MFSEVVFNMFPYRCRNRHGTRWDAFGVGIDTVAVSTSYPKLLIFNMIQASPLIRPFIMHTIVEWLYRSLCIWMNLAQATLSYTPLRADFGFWDKSIHCLAIALCLWAGPTISTPITSNTHRSCGSSILDIQHSSDWILSSSLSRTYFNLSPISLCINF